MEGPVTQKHNLRRLARPFCNTNLGRDARSFYAIPLHQMYGSSHECTEARCREAWVLLWSDGASIPDFSSLEFGLERRTSRPKFYVSGAFREEFCRHFFVASSNARSRYPQSISVYRIQNTPKLKQTRKKQVCCTANNASLINGRAVTNQKKRTWQL